MRKSLFMRLVLYCVIGGLCLLMIRSAGTFREDLPEDALPPVNMDKTTLTHLDEGKWEYALDDLIDMFRKEDSDPNLKHYIALCFKELGTTAFQERRYGEAIEMFEEGLSYVDDDVDMLMGLGAAMLLKSDYDGAESAFLDVLLLDPDNADAHGQLGEIYYLRNEWLSAEASWFRANELAPGNQHIERRLREIRKQLQLADTLDMDENVYFSVSYDGEAMPHLEYRVLEILESAYYDIGATLQAYPKRQIAVTLLTRQEYFDVTGSPEWSSGIYEGHIKIPVAGADADIARLKKTLYHEYVHAVLFDQVGARCPWWLNEGLAQYLSIDGGDDGVTGYATGELQARYSEVGLWELRGVLDLSKDDAGGAYAMALSAVRHLV